MPTVSNIPIVVRARDHLADMDVPEVQVSVCAEGDDECATPLLTAITDQQGQAGLTLPLTGNRGFGGYLELRAVDRVPTIVHLYPPPTGNSTTWLVGVFTQQQLETVAQLAGADTAKSTFGHLGALVENCNGVGAADVTFNLEDLDIITSWAYLQNNIPNPGATHTDETGAVGFFNVEPGLNILSASRRDTGQVIGRVPVLVRAGWVTTLVVPPTPL